MKFIFEIGLLAFVAALMLASIEATNAQPLVPPANQTHAKHASLFGITNTFNVSVYCSSGQVQHQSKTVQPGQPMATINVNCGGGGGGTGGTSGQPAPPPATICIITPTNSCASAFGNTTTTP